MREIRESGSVGGLPARVSGGRTYPAKGRVSDEKAGMDQVGCVADVSVTEYSDSDVNQRVWRMPSPSPLRVHRRRV
jgi:hypothetical protein